VVPRGVRHNTSAADETWIALIETVTTQHTGAEVTPMTRSITEQLGEVLDSASPDISAGASEKRAEAHLVLFHLRHG